MHGERHRPGWWLALVLATGACGSPTSGETGDEDVARVVTERGPVRVTLELRPAQPRLSDEPVFTLTVEAEEGVEVELPPFGASVGGFVIRDFHTPLPREEDGRWTRRQVYRLEPLVTGPHVLGPFPLPFDDHRAAGDGQRHTLETEPLSVEVVSMLSDEAPRLASLRPARDAVALPEPSLLPRIALAALALTLLVVAAVLWRRRRRGTRAAALRSPSQLAEDELRRLIGDDPLGRGEVQTFYVELTLTVRRYIERTTGIRAPEQTTPEFLHAMQDRGGFDEEWRRGLQAFLESADLVKFAGLRPQRDDVRASFESAQEFVGLTGAPLRLPGKAA